MTVPGLTEQQMKARRFKLTGSTFAAFLGYSPYRSPSAEWRIAMGKDEFTPTDDTVAGNFMEHSILSLALHKLEIPEAEAQRTTDSLFHAEHPDAIVVHPDCLLPGLTTGIQAKNHNPWVEKTYRGKPGGTGSEWDNELVPLLYNMQCQIEMEVLRASGWNVKHWYLAAFFGGSRLHCYKIAYHAKMVRGMLRAGLIFWRWNLSPDGPQAPPCDTHWIGRPATTPQIRKLTPLELEAVPIPFDRPDDALVTIPFLEG